ncbi:MAG: hypothetical protein ACRDZ4_06960 [Egibacteraceae bacterium]
MASRKNLDALEEIAKLRAHGRAQGWSIPQIVAAIVDHFGVSLLKAHRLVAVGPVRRRSRRSWPLTTPTAGHARS